MSWWLYALPLHMAGREGVWDWAAGASFSHGLPEHPPESRALPTAAQVLTAFTAAGCHGQAWFKTQNLGASSLPPCPDPADCARRGGLDLGEVTLSPPYPQDSKCLAPGTPIKDIGFRKPSPAAVLAALCTLTATAGPLLIFDDNADRVFVIHEGDQPDNLAACWPW